MLRGDLGLDVWSNRSVAAIVFEALPHTLALTALGLGWSVALGIVLGCFSATHRGSWADRAIGVVSVSAIAVPSFVVALCALLSFAVALTRRRLKRGTFRSIVELQAAIHRYLAEHNDDPKPFVWTQPAAQILAKANHLNASVH